MSAPPPKPARRPVRAPKEPQPHDADGFDIDAPSAGQPPPRDPQDALQHSIHEHTRPELDDLAEAPVTLPEQALQPDAAPSREGSLPPRPAHRPPRPANRPIHIQPAPADPPHVRQQSEVRAELEALDRPGAAHDEAAVQRFKDVASRLEEEGPGGKTAASLGFPALGPDKAPPTSAVPPQRPSTRPTRFRSPAPADQPQHVVAEDQSQTKELETSVAAESRAVETSDAAESRAVESPAAESRAVESPAAKSRAVESPAAESPAVESPSVESPAVESPAVESPAVESPAEESPAAESPAVESPAVEAQARSLSSQGSTVKDTIATRDTSGTNEQPQTQPQTQFQSDPQPVPHREERPVSSAAESRTEAQQPVSSPEIIEKIEGNKHSATLSQDTFVNKEDTPQDPANAASESAPTLSTEQRDSFETPVLASLNTAESLPKTFEPKHVEANVESETEVRAVAKDSEPSTPTGKSAETVSFSGPDAVESHSIDAGPGLPDEAVRPREPSTERVSEKSTEQPTSTEPPAGSPNDLPPLPEEHLATTTEPESISHRPLSGSKDVDEEVTAAAEASNNASENKASDVLLPDESAKDETGVASGKPALGDIEINKTRLPTKASSERTPEATEVSQVSAAEAADTGKNINDDKKRPSEDETIVSRDSEKPTDELKKSAGESRDQIQLSERSSTRDDTQKPSEPDAPSESGPKDEISSESPLRRTDSGDPKDASAKPPRPLHRPETKPKPVPKPKPKGALTSRFEAALRENETPKPKPVPRPKPRDGAAGSRISAIQASMFANLNEALSRGPPPSGRPRFESSESQDGSGENASTEPSAPEQKKVDANESAEAQLQAMPKNPRARAAGPRRAKRLPESAKPKFSIVTAEIPLWQIPSSESVTPEVLEAPNNNNQERATVSLEAESSRDPHEPVPHGSKAKESELSMERIEPSLPLDDKEPVPPASELPDQSSPKDRKSYPNTETNDDVNNDDGLYSEPTVETRWVPDSVTQAVPSQKARSQDEDYRSNSIDSTISEKASPRLGADTEDDLRSALERHLSHDSSELNTASQSSKSTSHYGIPDRAVTTEDLPALGSLIDRVSSPPAVGTIPEQEPMDTLMSPPGKRSHQSSVHSLGVESLSQYLDKSPQTAAAPSGWDRMPASSQLNVDQAEDFLKNMKEMKSEYDSKLKQANAEPSE